LSALFGLNPPPGVSAVRSALDSVALSTSPTQNFFAVALAGSSYRVEAATPSTLPHWVWSAASEAYPKGRLPSLPPASPQSWLLNGISDGSKTSIFRLLEIEAACGRLQAFQRAAPAVQPDAS